MHSMQQLFGVYMGVQSHAQTLQSMWRTVHAAAKDVVRDWKVGAGGLRVLSFATFVVEGATFDVLLKPKVNVTLC